MSQIKSYNVQPENVEIHQKFEAHCKKTYKSKSRIINKLIYNYVKSLEGQANDTSK